MAARTRDPQAKRAALISAASSLFAAAGFEAASTSSIASDAGVSEGLVYHYFESKHGLLEACVLHQSSAVVDRAISHHPLDFDAMLEEVFSWVATDPMTARLAAGEDERVMAALRRGWQGSVVPALTEALAVEQVAGRCRSGDATVLAHLQFAVVGEAMALHFRPDPIWAAELDVVVSETARTLRAIVA